jgi:hypothetical protein
MDNITTTTLGATTQPTESGLNFLALATFQYLERATQQLSLMMSCISSVVVESMEKI